MSQENIELVRRYIDEINRGRDWGAAGAGFISDDIEIDWSRSPAPYRGIYRGREAALRFAEELEVWEEARIEPKDFISVGDDVLVPHVVHLRGRDGLEVKVHATYVYTVRDGLCVRWRIYQGARRSPRRRRPAGVAQRGCAWEERKPPRAPRRVPLPRAKSSDGCSRTQRGA